MSIGSVNEIGDVEIQRVHFFATGLHTRAAVARLP